jgi:FkbM family methyltransferase
MYYGQFDPPTDKVIETYFKKGYVGNAIDVGASHGTVSSNTFYFEQMGWNVLCIEPNPFLYRQLARNRRNSMGYAVDNIHGDKVPFHVVVLENGDQTALSSLEIDERQYKKEPVQGIHQIEVSTRTLDWCIEHSGLNFKKIDFISIDTEGTELRVLKSFDINKWRVPLLVVENNHEEDRYVENYLKEFNYKLDQRHGVNEFYILSENKVTHSNTTNTTRKPRTAKRVSVRRDER